MQRYWGCWRDAGHGHGVLLLLLSQGRDLGVIPALGIPPGGSGYVPDKGGWWDGEGLPMALAASQGSVHDGDAAHTLLSLAASSPCSFASWLWCLSLPGPWQAAFSSGSPGTPREGGGQDTDPRTCPCCREASLSSQVGEGRSRLQGKHSPVHV